MSDLDDYRALLRRTRVQFTEEPHPRTPGHTKLDVDSYREPGFVNDGHPGFLAGLEFDEAGKLVRFGLWE